MTEAVNPAPNDAAILAIDRPHRALWTYYLVTSLAFPPAFLFVILPLYFRYHTMRYTFTNEGISMRWGILFRREIIISYSRIQDIHLRANFLERWLGLARVLVQTASGNSGAEMTLEGLREFEDVRDFLYARMRGVKDHAPHAAPASAAAAIPPAGFGHEGDLAAALREVARELRETRLALEQRAPAVRPPSGHV